MTSERNDDDDRTIVWEALADTLRPYAGWLFFGFGALLVVIGYFGISAEPAGDQVGQLLRDHGLDVGDPAAPSTTTEVVPAAVNGHARRPAPADDHVVAVPSGSSFHRPSCALVAAKDATPLTAAEAGARGLRPCGVGDPQVAVTSR